MIARSDEEWRALWAAHAGPEHEAPPVDFAARMVAAVFQGQRPSAGFDTTIVDARADGDVLTVQVDEHLPAAGRAAAHVLVSPFHIVSMPRVEGEVRFEDVYHTRQRGHASAAPSRRDPDAAGSPRRSLPAGVIVYRARAGDRGRAGLPGRTAVRCAVADRRAHEPLCALPRLAGAARTWARWVSARFSASAWRS